MSLIIIIFTECTLYTHSYLSLLGTNTNDNYDEDDVTVNIFNCASGCK